MREFYSEDQNVSTPVIGGPSPTIPLPTHARVAVYDAPGSAPRVHEVEPAGVAEYLESLTTLVYQCAREQGGDIPYTAIREVTENFIHASFAEPVVSILEAGQVIRFADQGPGFGDCERAVFPGFTTATQSMKCFIRGVGSGLPIVKDYLSLSGGSLTIEDNLGPGSVVTLSSKPLRTEDCGVRGSSSGIAHSPGAGPASGHTPSLLDEQPLLATPILSTRQKQVLALVMESGSAGPSLVSKELDVGISTAYRDLASLEEMGLISAESGKRRLTNTGMSYLDDLMTRS
jgi:hypothetical protein